MRLASETAAFLKLFINSSALSGVPCITKSLHPTIYLLNVHAGDSYRLLMTYHAARPSLSPLNIKHLHEVPSPVEFKCRISFSSKYCMGMYSYASNRRHVMRRGWRSACSACAPAANCRPSQQEERRKSNPLHPSARGWFTSYGLFLLHSTVIERRLDGADCFRHQTSYSPSIRAVTCYAASYVESFLHAFTGRKKENTVCLPRVQPLLHPLTSPASPFHSQLMLTGM